jgi:hypothetical protein
MKLPLERHSPPLYSGGCHASEEITMLKTLTFRLPRVALAVALIAPLAACEGMNR